MRIRVRKCIDSCKGILQVVLCDKKEVKDLSKMQGSLEAQLDELISYILFSKNCRLTFTHLAI